MILSKYLNYNSSRYAGDNNHDDDIVQIDTDLNRLYTGFQGNVRFGTGVSGNGGENIFGQWLTITTNAIANTESTFTHTCMVVPIGYIIIWQDKAGSIYQGPTTGTAWTSNTISLKCSVASVTASLFLLK